ncbi:hypothetical protein IFHNHDMJ_01575 [Synechococcus sp. CBW1107]|nr:hypothetical protein IFHNHDMJ_01575 [Synechococcus sp. CBW1107]
MPGIVKPCGPKLGESLRLFYPTAPESGDRAVIPRCDDPAEQGELDTVLLSACFPVTKAVMETDAGTIELELFDADAPGTVANFVKLAEEGFYDGLAFHRVIDGFMAQGGCPNSREGARGMAGTGGPGYTIPCEINGNKHQAGSLSMAHAGKNTGGSQFFLCHGAQPHLDGVHTVFGHTGNMDVVMALRNGSRINTVTIQK